ncbi:MAG: MBL fold metallo-hydrolase [Desulfobacteraceae bacterium]|jgi:hydroxyacylglutathione hydrolase|nr:MBL fold metallo-hydrolase [Desulfobacteraceae bacterium]
MKIKAIYLPQMANFCYMIGDEATQTCAVIDPAFDPQKILNIVNDAGYTITHVINTHGHSDHTSGNAAIIEATGAQLCIHKSDSEQVTRLLTRVLSRFMGGKGSPKASRILEDNDIITLGETELKVLHTPGHTPGSICIYAEGHVFTGDTLFVQAVGRTDLPGGSSKQLLTSVHEKIYTLPEDTKVWPGHDYGPSPSSTVAAEKQNNPFT